MSPMNTRVVFEHEIDEVTKVVILAWGEVDLDTLASIETYCHRQRLAICQRMQAELKKPEPGEESKACTCPGGTLGWNNDCPSHGLEARRRAFPMLPTVTGEL